jgi:serine/threonine protein kinase
MGIVYAAYDPKLDRRVALKLLRNDAALGVGASARLFREAQAMARLSHPNVVAVHDVGAVGDDVFVAMEYVEGETLAAWLRERKRTSAEVLGAFRMAGAGLAAAHAAGIIHRDFKPDNVLVGNDSIVRVTDFGLARTDVLDLASDAPASTPPATSPALTQRGLVMGTPAYMAPEQAEGGLVDARSDLFSFCVALYQALYGERPFAGRTLGELCSAVRRGSVREPPRGSNVALWVRRVLLRGLADDPAKRYPSMSALLAALARDPIVARRRMSRAALLVAVVAGASALTSWALDSRAPTCTGAERMLEGAWDEVRRDEVQAAFLASGQVLRRGCLARDRARARRLRGALDRHAHRGL